MAANRGIRKDFLGGLLSGDGEGDGALNGLMRLTHRDPSSLPLEEAREDVRESPPPETSASSLLTDSSQSRLPEPGETIGGALPALSTEALSRLEAVRADLVSFLPASAEASLSTSLVAEAAMRIVLADFKKLGGRSRLAAVLAAWFAER